ncbi:diguanylate cyclase [Lentibacillus juripiscarius]|uniref:Diguanylate cyclase n=2 Tax=Lentibacillus juripiscarius TaxID=257446 RepID=A0ABW5V4M7_9BACI
MVVRRKIIVLWVMWVILWPLLLLGAYQYYYVNISGHSLDIALFALLMGAVAWFPLTIKDNPVFFVNGISMVVFLVFGLFAEILLTQLAVIIVLLKIGAGKKDAYRYPLNMLMFSFVSVIAAEVFVLFGGSHASLAAQGQEQIAAIFGYALTIYLLNVVGNKLVDKLFYRRQIKLIDEGMKWEVVSALFTIPVGFVLFVIYTEIGIIGIFYLGIPFVFISIILMLLYSYREINRLLERTGEIGHRLTYRMDVANVYDVFTHEISQLLPVDYVYIYMVNNGNLRLERFCDVQLGAGLPPEPSNRDKSFSRTVWETGKPLQYRYAPANRRSDGRPDPAEPESVLSMPVEYGDTITGVVTVESVEKHAFEKMHFQVMNILTNYLGVAVENAKNYEVTKLQSERDGLTNLYNLTYMEKLLDNFFVSDDGTHEPAKASLIILDLDYFKQVNDTYGHEAGNEILCQIAARVSDIIGNKGTAGRYGGEEFVIFLPHIGLAESRQIAELLRAGVSDEPFYTQNHLSGDKQLTTVKVTVSVGVAAYPTHCETPSELFRHADRAMYMGAKRKGRNRVAVYKGLQTS